MSQAAKVQEPSMEEILASIRRIISDDDTGKAKPARPVEPPVLLKTPPSTADAPSEQPANSQVDIDAMLAEINAEPAPTMAVPTAEPSSPAVEPAPAAAAEADVLQMTEGASIPPAPPPPAPASPFQTIDPESDLLFADKAAPELPPRGLRDERRAFATMSGPMSGSMSGSMSSPERPLLSNVTEAAVDNAFTSLANTVLGSHMRTLEDLVQEMLRPMLKGWLDNNLPSLVERIVRDEIERVSRGRH